MFRPLRLCTAFGIGIYLHWTFLLLPLWVFYSNLKSGGVDLALFSVAMVGAVFGCVVLHELGHALMARRFGIPTRSITLYPIGGVARLERMSERPAEEFWIAVAGPAVNVAIAGILGMVLYLAGIPFGPSAGINSPERLNFWWVLLGTNIGLVVFNMVPAFPMDGGRVFRAILSWLFGRVRATEIAVGVGVVLAVGFLFVGLIQGWWVLALIGVFVYLSGQQELAAVRYQAMPRPEAPLEVWPIDDPMAVSQPQANPDFSGFLWDPRNAQWVVWRNGRPVNTISVD
jgi:Zn-dependent protease